MSLLSKLLGGDKNVEKAAKDLLNGLVNAYTSESQNRGNAAHEAPNRSAAPQARDTDRPAPSGFSWGEVMPAEENQYNYNGTFWQYFENLFRTDFPDLRYEKNVITPDRRITYTFYSGGARLLAVELMSQRCSAYKFRSDCEREGLPYLRFYIDHDGWWNTRAYVVSRMRGAMNG